jgi:hypothetical protein
MNNQDIYYNKYIKYKKKYLELKELNGSGFITKIFYPNSDLYGSKYNYLEDCLIKTKVIKQIIDKTNPEYFKNTIINHKDDIVISKDCNEYCQQNNEEKRNEILLEKFVEKDIIKIIKNSKKNIKIIDTISVLQNIEKVLFNYILPGLYLKFEGKLEEENFFKKIDEMSWVRAGRIKDKEVKAKELKKEIKAQIKVQDDNIKKKIYKTNIANIIKVYNIFCKINKLYYDYYKNFINKELLTELIEEKKLLLIKLKEEKKLLLIELNKIQPKVQLLIEVVELYFDFLDYYITNDIKPYTTYISPFEGNICTNDKIEFINNIGSAIDNEKKIFHYKVYENIFYGNIVNDNTLNNNTLNNNTLNNNTLNNNTLNNNTLNDNTLNDNTLNNNTLNDLNNFYIKIKSLSAPTKDNIESIESMKTSLVDILQRIKKNIIFIKEKNNSNYKYNSNYLIKTEFELGTKENFIINNPFEIIINRIKTLNIVNNETIWINYYDKYKYLFEIDYFPFLLKKSINIYLYKIFNYIKHHK